MAIVCTAKALAASSQALAKLSDRSLAVINTWLLCKINGVGGFGLNLIPPNSQYSGGATPEFDLAVNANTSYIIVWGANDLSMKLCGVSYPSTGVGKMTVVFTGNCTLMQFFGTFGGTTVTARVRVVVSLIPTPTGFTWVPSSDGTKNVATWNNPNLLLVTYTELWTSTDNVNYSLAATVQFPTTTTSLAAPAFGTAVWAKIRWCSPTTPCGDFTAPQVIDGRVSDWAKRVVTNGGAMPSASTINAISNFAVSLRAGSMESDMITCNCFVPDNLIASLTPLYKTGSNDPWTNTSFVAADITARGLVSDGLTKWLNSGFVPSASSTLHNFGMSFFISQLPSLISAANFYLAGSQFPGGAVAILLQNAGTIQEGLESIANTVSGGAMSQGFYSANRVALADNRLFFGNATNPISQIGQDLVNNGVANATGAIYTHGQNLTGAVNGLTDTRFGLVAFHNGLSLAKATTLFNATTTLRNSFISNFTDTDMGAAWSARVVANGGAAPSAATVSAVNTFWNALRTAQIDGKMKAVNCFVPDNLIASITPLNVDAGNNPWTNTAFVAGDLTVNGLKGNGTTKWLNTGFISSASSILHSCALSVYVHTTATAGEYYCGAQFAGGNMDAVQSGGVASYNGFIETVAHPVTGAGGAGFTMVSRVANANLKMYFGNSTNAFAQTASDVVNGASAQPTGAIFAFCQNLTGAANAFSDGRISFMAISSGLSLAEGQALFNAVQALRVALGGGFA